jgi:CBS domain containing-hemolysin-like protein
MTWVGYNIATMGAFLTVLVILFLCCLVLVAAMHPLRPAYSLAELKRRSKSSEAFVVELDRYELYPGLVTFLRSVRAILLVLVTCFAIGAFGWFFGVIIAIITAFAYPALARVGVVQRGAAKLYGNIESHLLDFVAKFEAVLNAFREPATRLHEKPVQLHSKEELAEVIDRSKALVGEKERQLLVSALAFPDKTVESIMTPKSVIDFIKQSEFLGPLVLDELHALGHSRLPVIADDLDHVVGVLHLRDMLSLNVRESTTAQQAMEKKVFYIRHDDTLEHALAAFIKTRHHLFIVINENRETVGLLTLEDVMETLIGHKIVDEDDIHADLRAVAAREGKTNNAAEGHVDL